MNTTRIRPFASTAAILAATILPVAIHAKLRSKSDEIVVMKRQNPPEAAQIGGNSFFLHATNSGSFYLYVEQQSGTRLAAST